MRYDLFSKESNEKEGQALAGSTQAEQCLWRWLLLHPLVASFRFVFRAKKVTVLMQTQYPPCVIPLNTVTCKIRLSAM